MPRSALAWLLFALAFLLFATYALLIEGFAACVFTLGAGCALGAMITGSQAYNQ